MAGRRCVGAAGDVAHIGDEPYNPNEFSVHHPEPAMADQNQIDKIMGIAYNMMLSRREGRAGGAARSIRRSFEFGTGKKTAAKIGIGVAFGALAVGLSFASFGTAAPFIAAVAVGAFATGQLTNVGFAKLSGRKYRGVQRTNSWIEQYRNGQDDHAEELKSTNERAHKTIRRAFEHYRRGVRKATKLKESYLSAMDQPTCDAAADMVTRMFSVSHHWDKSRIYLVPALFLSQALLAAYEEMLQLFERSEAGMQTTLGELLDRHGPAPCDDVWCVATRNDLGQPGARPALRWDQAHIQSIRDRLDQHEDRILSAGFASRPPAVDGTVEIRTQQLFLDAGRAYSANRKRLGVRMSHGIKNVFARKTRSERISFGAGLGLSAVTAAAGGSVSGATAGMNMPAFFSPLVELGFQVTENSSGEVIDAAAGMADRNTGTTQIAHQREGTRTAADAQDVLQKAAEHMQEILKVGDLLQEAGRVGDRDCPAVIERLRTFYKIHHHLGKVEDYLGTGIDRIEVLATALAQKMDRFVPAHDRIWAETARIIATADHTQCAEVCYEIGGSGRRIT